MKWKIHFYFIHCWATALAALFTLKLNLTIELKVYKHPQGNIMKKLNTTRTLLSVALMGAFAVTPFMAPTAQAAPPSYAPAYGRRAKEKKEERREERKAINNRGNVSLSGTVLNVRSGNSFDLRANGRVYNVYTSSSVPRGLSRGDKVSLNGRSYGDNDIRNANVRITENNRNNVLRRNNADDQSYIGIVTSVRSNREFDVRVGSKIYNVYASSDTRGLSKNDEVRVYGQRSGDNDIRYARVNITRNR